MPPKKKPPKNSYYFFMKELQQQREREGRPIKGGMAKVAEIAAPLWKNLSPAEKAKYEKLAKEYKQVEKGNLENKFTTTGESYALLIQKQKQEEQRMKKMWNDIQNEVRHCFDAGKLPDHRFYFIHINYYCRTTTDDRFLPCELAIIQYTLETGINQVYHSFIDCGPLPLGYKFEAMKLAEDSHQIELPPLSRGESSYRKLLAEIKDFISGSDMEVKSSQLPPMYTSADCIECVSNVIEQFCDKSGDDPEIFRIYPLHKLLFVLKATVVEDQSDALPESLVELELKSDVFLYTKGIACRWHEEESEAFQFCSQGFVKRWSYIVSDHCCPFLKIDLLPGSHIPPHVDVDRAKHREDNSRTWPETTPKKDVKKAAHGRRNSPPHSRNVTTFFYDEDSDDDDDDEELKPLRRPMTRGLAHEAFIASQASRESQDKDGEGPWTTVGRGRGIGTNLPDLPIGVAGRGASVGRGVAIDNRDHFPILGRGRGLAAQFTKLNLE